MNCAILQTQERDRQENPNGKLKKRRADAGGKNFDAAHQPQQRIIRKGESGVLSSFLEREEKSTTKKCKGMSPVR